MNRHITARFGAAPDTLTAHGEDRLAALMAEDARACAKRVARTTTTTQAQPRDHIYKLIALELRARGEGTVSELSEAVGLSKGAMRLRLKEMEAKGRVAHRRRVTGNGHVTHVFRLTEGEG
jgi:predicted transcriptional regulator